MTEQEWLECTEPKLMLDFLRGKTSNRKLILFSLACWTQEEWYAEPDWVEMITKVTDAVLAGAEPLIKLVGLFGAFNFSNSSPLTAQTWADIVIRNRPNPHLVQTRLIGEVLGNPFRPLNIDRRWQTSTVVDLATAIYRERAWDRMPILADALMDAGCDNDEIISHCRGPGPHVRGCFVVDLILGKE